MKRLIKKLINWCSQLGTDKLPINQELIAGTTVVFWTKETETIEEANFLEDFVEVGTFSRLRIYNKIVYRRVHPLLKEDSVLHAFDNSDVRYNPYHLNTVLLCKLSEN